MATENERFPSDYINAGAVQDLGGKLIATIDHISMDEFKGRDGKPDELKPTATFRETDKKWVIGKTNWKNIALKTMLTDDREWSGVTVTLGVHQTQLGPGITVLDAALPAGAEPNPTDTGEDQESVPF